ncbi:lanthionine synthetase C family protein [Rhizohabitans arisaemae]|uniref:lanthionine synthetase C family protein n=1 Tax=Rhizohabitans arisaemae TaxID=2720610 RepID=UPI0024B283FD|nr:lanthionine synthetase C family protein [Rhizohabitans arisaemae]
MRGTQHAGRAQSLADGAPGIALPHIERAHAEVAGWEPVHRLAQEMTAVPVHAHPEITSLFYGAPAVAYALHTAGHPAYARALATLDHSINTLIRIRLDAAHRRIDNGQMATAREYDLINGITGLGGYLIHRHHDHELLRQVLAYLVRLTQPVRLGGETLPGWWAAGSPDRRRSPRWDGGHAGFGMAHGISGPLALLSTAMRRRIIVNGQCAAIHSISVWLDHWRADHGSRAWWPESIDRDELRSGLTTRTGPHRPSWCYGAPGIACAQHLAGLATGDRVRTRIAEQALVGCLTDGRQLAHFTDAGLCHGWAGLIHTARRVHADTGGSELSTAIDTVEDRLRRHLHKRGAPADEGFLEGRAGIALVEEILPTASAAGARWNTCLFTG